MDKLKGGSDEVETLEDMIDVESDLERYQKENKTSTIISNGLV